MKHERLIIALAVAAGWIGVPSEAVSALPERVLSGSKLIEVCSQIQSIFTQPPSVESYVIGTLDAASGNFTWDPAVTFVKNSQSDRLVNLSPAIQVLGIRPVTPNFTPVISNIPLGTTAVGQAVSNPVVHSAPAPARPIGAAPARKGSAPAPRLGAAAPAAEVGTSAGTPGIAPLFSIPHLPVHSGMLKMVFRVANRPVNATFTAEAYGGTVSAQSASNPNVVEIVLPARGQTSFQVKCGSASYGNNLYFDRPPVLGCFVLDAYPIAYIYEPPGSLSSQSYTATNVTGTVLKTFTGSEDGQSHAVQTAFSTVTGLIDALGGIGKVVAMKYPAVGQAMQGASDLLKAAWGSSQTTEGITINVTSEHSLESTVTSSSGAGTVMHQGPGKGDVIYYMKKPHFVWLAATDEASGNVYVTVSLLGYEGIGAFSAQVLRDHPNDAGIPAEAVQLLLQSDPLTPEYRAAHKNSLGAVRPGLLGLIPSRKGLGAPGGNPVPGRLVEANPFSFDFGGSVQPHSEKREITQTDTRSESATRNRTTTETGGFLSYVMTNVPQTGTTSVSTVQGVTTETTTGKTVEVSYSLGDDTGNAFHVNAYYDTVYGTFAVVPADTGGVPVAGTAYRHDGQPARGLVIRLLANGLVYESRADAQGHFSFRDRTLKRGNHTLVAGATKQALRFEGKSIQGIALNLKL